ncbi:MAG: peptide deformylase [Sulfuricurvum sp.]|uniref:peptide deformylase n=1 Tax=Sulfuricurvum sp. TaxID=2025608 RepID=UPI0026388C2A|nr:peptide deformylase [Sulfuricurvum sp.]MDD2829781.1 peptide deformylase [Sulfuricurvum sp.]MDD4948425.1 peptide deformylase [Sulfuricurvum sp.]
MLKELITYPDERIRYISADIRKYDDELFELLENMHDTMAHHGLDAISAIQIAIPFSAILIQNGDEIIEMVNARLIMNEGAEEIDEVNPYFPKGFSAKIKRYSKIKVVYENRHGELRHLDAEGDLSFRLQRQMDFLFGGTLLDKLGKDARKMAEEVLVSQHEGIYDFGVSCPTVFVRDYFKKGAKYLMGGVALSFITPLFVSPSMREMIYRVDKYTLVGVVLLMIIYFFYSQHEAKLYKQCTSCQIGNIIGTVAIMTLQLLIVALGVFLWIAPCK